MKSFAMTSLLGAMLLSSLLYAQNDTPLGDVARQSRATSAALRKANPNSRPPVWEDGKGGGEDSASAGADEGDQNASDTNSAKGIVDRGLALDHQGRFDEALLEYNKAIALEPNYGRAYNDIGVVKAEKRDAAGAIEAYRRAIELNYRSHLPYVNLGITLNEQGRFAEAEDVLRNGLAKVPNNCCILLQLGHFLVGQRRFEEAIVCYREALRIEPWRQETRRALYDTLIQVGRRDEAEKVRAESYSYSNMSVTPRK
jgi:tetratricopeptide (TPR) repeat protein